MQSCRVVLANYRLRDALKCISEATVMVSKAADLKASEQISQRLLLTVRSRLTVLTAGHERKHNACKAETGGCVSDYTHISRVPLYLRPQRCRVAYLC